MVRPIRSVHLFFFVGLSQGDQILNSVSGLPSASHEASLEWGAAALNMTADLVLETHSAPDGGTPEAAATKLRKLSSKLMDTSAGPPSKADAKLALKLGANALKLGAKVMASTEVGAVPASDFSSNSDTGRHARELVADHHEAASTESANLEWFKNRFVHGESDGEHGKQVKAPVEVKGVHAKSKMQRNEHSDTMEPPVLQSRDLLQNALSTDVKESGSQQSLDSVFMASEGEEDVVGEQHGHNGHPTKTVSQHQQKSHEKLTLDSTFEDGGEDSMASVDASQTCSFTLTLSRSHGDKKDFDLQVTSAIDDIFHVEGCSKHGCDANRFCAHQCMKQGAAGINVIKNQHGEEAGYGSCCSEKNVIVHTEGCAEAPLDSELATDLAHRFPFIAAKVIKGAIRQAGGDRTIATEELRNLAPPDHDDKKPAPTSRLLRKSTRTNFKEEAQHFSQHVTPSMGVDQMRDEAEQEQSAAKVGPEVADPELKLVVKHMPQTGGPLLNSVLSQMLGQHNLVQYVDEHTPLTSTGENDFVISTMRNPCDWYVSLWASAPQTDRELLNVQYGTAADPAPFFDRSNANRTKFSQWLHWAQGGRRVKAAPFGNSVMSLRYWESLVAGTIAQGYSTTTLGSYTKGYEGREDVNTGLQTFAAGSPVDCWVSDESFVTDVQHCLSEYEERSGVSLDWEPFYQRLGGEGGHAPAKFDSVQRKSCDFYYDNDDAESVLSSDDNLFKAFNFGTCCGPTK